MIKGSENVTKIQFTIYNLSQISLFQSIVICLEFIIIGSLDSVI